MPKTPLDPHARNGHVADVEVDGRSYAIARKLGEIDLDDMTTETHDAGGHAIWWGVLYAAATREEMRAKQRIAVVRAEVEHETRTKAKHNDERITDKDVESRVTLDKRVQAAVDLNIEAEYRKNALRSVAYAVEQKNRTVGALNGVTNRERGAMDESMREKFRQQAAAARGR